MKDLCDRVDPVSRLSASLSLFPSRFPFFILSLLALRSGNYRIGECPSENPSPLSDLPRDQQSGGQCGGGNGLARPVVSLDRAAPTTRFPSFCFLKYPDDRKYTVCFILNDNSSIL